MTDPLPVMEGGTDRQIDAAIGIRRTAIDLVTRRGHGSRPCGTPGWSAHDSWTPVFELVAEAYRGIVVSRWWLDHADTVHGFHPFGWVLLAMAEQSGVPAIRGLWQSTLQLAYPDIVWPGHWVHDIFVPTGRWPELFDRPLPEVLGETEPE
ncbi:hypothetical protein ACL02S_22825 [Nocardia sp. 004]|uniref:hypothetical protein n=1 Tax=Nocardia sp. 004 TaxID=3385978 RepID=UPI00399F3902